MKKALFNGLMVISQQTPFTLPILFFILFVTTLDTRYMILMALVFFNMLVNSILKIITKRGYKLSGKDTLPLLGKGYRPQNHMNCSVLGGKVTNEQTFGMPSGHSQIIWSVIAYIVTFLYYENRYKPDFKYYFPFQVLLLCMIGLTVSFSRVHIGCHTVMQVVIGGLIGIGIGYGAYVMYPHPKKLDN